MVEAEKKAKESDARRTQMIFDIEKEKARWQMENDSILVQKRELEEIISNLERRKENLFKDNERLKHELKQFQSQEQQTSKLNISLGSGLLKNLEMRKSSKTN